MWVLGVASALATVGIVWLAVKTVTGAPPWSLGVLRSPQVIWCLVLIGGGLLVLGLLAGVLIRLKPKTVGAPRALHGDQGGTAAVEMAFVFPLALMIFMMITQAALLFNANVLVHYATFAAARVAVVTVPMTIGGEVDKRVWPCTADTQGPSEKIEMMRQAAVLALLPISSELTAAAGQANLSTVGQMIYDETKHVFSYADGKDQWWFHRVKAQYDYANAFTKIELAAPWHWRDDGNPDTGCPNTSRTHTDLTTWLPSTGDYRKIPWCDFYHQVPPIWDFNWYEEVWVRVTYNYLLEVPYASRFLGDPIDVPGRTGKSYAAKIKWATSLTCEGGPEILPGS
jgi:hypothetical protein